jgi:hypothetical protein
MCHQVSRHRFLLLQRFLPYKMTCNYDAQWQKVAPVPHLPGRHRRQGVISVGTDTNTWRLGWGFLRFSHCVRVNAAYLKCVTTLCFTHLPMYYSLTIAPSVSIIEGRPGWQIYFLLSVKKKWWSISFEFAESKHGTQHALPPTTAKGERFKTKKYFLNKKGLTFRNRASYI